MFVVHAYVTYLVLSVAITVWVAYTLYKNGRLFLVDSFHGNEPLADSVNRLLVVGFYLINLGWIISSLRMYGSLDDPRLVIEALSDKIGTVLFVLGVMHLFNLYVFNRMRRRALDDLPTAMPPIPPTGTLPRG